jgi:hypothetical protein
MPQDCHHVLDRDSRNQHLRARRQTELTEHQVQSAAHRQTRDDVIAAGPRLLRRLLRRRSRPGKQRSAGCRQQVAPVNINSLAYPHRGLQAVSPLELNLKQRVGIVVSLEPEEHSRLRIGRPKLFRRRVQTMGQVIPSASRQRRVDQVTGHRSLGVATSRRIRLLKQHHEGQHPLVGETAS